MSDEAQWKMKRQSRAKTWDFLKLAASPAASSGASLLAGTSSTVTERTQPHYLPTVVHYRLEPMLYCPTLTAMPLPIFISFCFPQSVCFSLFYLSQYHHEITHGNTKPTFLFCISLASSNSRSPILTAS
jgi:hypothetical protein